MMIDIANESDIDGVLLEIRLLCRAPDDDDDETHRTSAADRSYRWPASRWGGRGSAGQRQAGSAGQVAGGRAELNSLHDLRV